MKVIGWLCYWTARAVGFAADNLERGWYYQWRSDDRGPAKWR